jgi:hypothetical protein
VLTGSAGQALQQTLGGEPNKMMLSISVISKVPYHVKNKFKPKNAMLVLFSLLSYLPHVDHRLKSVCAYSFQTFAS